MGKNDSFLTVSPDQNYALGKSDLFFRKNRCPILMLIQYWLDYQFLFVWYWSFLMMEKLQMEI